MPDPTAPDAPPPGPPPHGPPLQGPPLPPPTAGGWATATLPPPQRPARPPLLAPAQVAVALGVGVLAAAVVPGRPAGLGAVVVTWLAAVAIAAARRLRGDGGDDTRADRDDDADRARWWAVACGTLAVALATLPVVTDAAWVLGLTTVAALGLAGVAVGGGATWVGLLRTSGRGTAALGHAISSTVAVGRRVGRRSPTRARQVWTAVATIVLLLVFGGLFAAADAVFADLLGRFLVPDLAFWPSVGRVLLAMVVTVLVGALVLLRPQPSGDLPLGPATRRLSGGEWRTPLAALVLLFAAFLVVQAGALFTDHTAVVGTAGLTYADAAREGFAQLLVVAVLTLAVVAVVGRYAALRGPVDVRVRAVLLGVLCLETVAVLASALQRLVLYEQAYGFTRDRLVAHATILWLAGVFALLLLCGAVRATRHLPRAAVVLTGVALLAFGALRPDALVAQGNVARFAATGDLDPSLLASLSADAAPAIATLPDPVRACIADLTRVPGDEHDLRANGPAARADAAEAEASWAAWNLARSRAATITPPAGAAECPPP